MKRVSALVVFTTLTLPAFAENIDKAVVTESAKPEVKAVTTEAKIDSKASVPAKTETKPVSVKPAEEKVYENKASSRNKFPKGLQFGLGASATSGVNGFVGYANKNFDSFWWKRFGGRLDFATTSPIQSSIDSAIKSQMGDGVDVGDGMTINSGTIGAQHFGALLDFYPFGNTWFLGGWRLTGGYMFGNMDVSAKLTSNVEGMPSDPMEFELNGEQYRYTGGQMKGTAAVNWNYAGPYLGTGFDLGLLWGIKIFMDAGVVFTSKTAQANLNVPLSQLQYNDGGTWKTVEGDSALTTLFTSNKTDALKEANDELGKLNFFPIIKLGFMYRF